MTYFSQNQPNLSFAKLICLKKRNFFAKSTLGCNWVPYVKNGLFGFIFETSGVILLNLTKFNNGFPIIFKICLNIACLLQKSQEIFSLCTNFEIFQKSSVKIKIFLHILIVLIMYESGKVKKIQSNKIGITIYSWTLCIVNLLTIPSTVLCWP